jgi:DNA ligase 1
MMLKMNQQRRHFSFRLLAVLGTLGGALPALAKASLPVLLAHNAPKSIDPTGYLVSEKLDGVRALWDGTVLRFRSGRTIAAPAWFTSKLPATPLDGELWLARGQFDALSGMVRKAQPVDAEWQQVKYMVFELPQGSGTFAQRAAQLQSLVQAAAWPALQAVEQFAVANPAALQAKLKSITAAGGEGLMLHLASAPVTAGRSDVLLN